MGNPSTKLGSDTLEWLETLVAPDQFTKEEYEYQGDRRALALFHAVPGADWLGKKFINVWVKFELADLLGTSIKVSENQFPEIHDLINKISKILGISPPPVYLKESPDLNAWTFGTDEKNVYVVVTRGLIVAAKPRELAFVIGHEMGHVKSQHVLYHTIAQWLAGTGIFAVSMVPIPGAREIANLVSYPAQIVLKAWHRRAEVTADRAGLISCQEIGSAQRALALTGLGSRELADRINVDELESQVAKDYGRWGEIFRDHPYLPKRLTGIRLFSNSQFYLHRILQDKHTSFLTSQDLDTATAKVLRN